MMENDLLGLIEKRRSIYSLGDDEVLSQDEIVNTVQQAVKYCPSSFNSQSARVVVLFGSNHKKLWNIVLSELKKVVPASTLENTEKKIASFAKGYGTILFFEDMDVVKNLQEKFPLYADNFPKWSLQSNGMLEYLVWIALAEQNVGASLQHYNPLIDEEVRKTWKLPQSWMLLAEMPFGNIEAPAGEKSFLPIEDRVKVFK